MSDGNCSAPGPQRIYDLLVGYWKTGIVKAAIELDVFSSIAAGENSIRKLASSRGVEERGLRVLLDSLCGLELLKKEGAMYVLTSEADHYLVKGKPAYVGGAADAFVPVQDWEVMGRIETAVQEGGPLVKGERDPAFWENVARGLIPLGIHVGRYICDLLNIAPGSQEGLRVLDIACGSGVYGYSILQRDVAATGTAFDFGPVLRLAKDVAREMGVADRVNYQSGNIENPDFGKGVFDLAVISHILQGYGPPMIEKILGNICDALVPGGRLVIHEFVPDEERATKSLPLLFAVYMFVVTPGGGTYTLSEFSQWLRGAGFRDVTLHDLPTQTSIILAQK